MISSKKKQVVLTDWGSTFLSLLFERGVGEVIYSFIRADGSMIMFYVVKTSMFEVLFVVHLLFLAYSEYDIKPARLCVRGAPFWGRF